MSNKLGKINRVDLREVWSHEARHFTNWLAENLDILGNELGVNINLIETEASVGKFSVDILAEEEISGKKIIIENQLEATDHEHLGKVITYAAGLDAGFVVWVVREEREEFRRAIDWLNEHTDDEISFFLVRVELWKIDNSLPAPKFEVLSKPNDWAKFVKSSLMGSISETKIKQKEFWDGFKKYAQEHNTILRLGRTPRPQYWYDISIGFSSLAHIALTINSLDGSLRVELYIKEDKSLFDFLEKHKVGIESKAGKLIWNRLDDKKASYIRTERKFDIDDQKKREEYFDWLQKNSENFYKVFTKYIEKYKSKNHK